MNARLLWAKVVRSFTLAEIIMDAHSTYVAKNCPTFIFSNKQNYGTLTHALFGRFFKFIFFCFALRIFGCLKAAVKLDSKSDGCIYLWIIFALFSEYLLLL